MDNLLYSVDTIRAVEVSASAALGEGVLMQRAGEAAARFALELLGERRDLPVLLVAGPGNNGGDALETAANLRHAGVDAQVLHLPGAGAPSHETAQALQRARESGVRFVGDPQSDTRYALVVDGMFGIGLTRPLQARFADLAGALGRLGCPVLALDVPSGLDADTGAVIGHGDSKIAVQATHTITFIGDKPGLHTGDGRDYAGKVLVATLGIDPQHFGPPDGVLSTPLLFNGELTRLRRRHNTHKGSYGDVAVLGGAQGMAGAPVLAARGALFTGAGRVFVAALNGAAGYDSAQPELMFRDAVNFDIEGRTFVAGPGMGESHVGERLLSRLIDSKCPLVLDADALNRLAEDPDMQARLGNRGAPAILTPHPLEAARLLGVTSGIVQADRVEAARELTSRFKATVVLKGSGTVIAGHEGRMAINPTGNPGLASAGTGDVLSGICAALLAQGWDAWHAALCGVWVHGAAADMLVARGTGPIGMTAGELPPAARDVLNQMVADAAAQV